MTVSLTHRLAECLGKLWNHVSDGDFFRYVKYILNSEVTPRIFFQKYEKLASQETKVNFSYHFLLRSTDTNRTPFSAAKQVEQGSQTEIASRLVTLPYYATKNACDECIGAIACHRHFSKEYF